MKKRIIAILLSVSVFFCSFGIGNRRAYATGAEVGVIIAIGVLAWELIGVCTGMYDGAASAIGTFIESGVDGLTNPDSNFQQGFKGFADNWLDGWDAICDSLQDLFNKGELEIVDGKIKLTYDQIQKIYGQLWELAPKPGLDFDSKYPSFFIDFDGMPFRFPIGALPTVPYLLNVTPGEAYAACFYNDNQIVFSDYYFSLFSDEVSAIHTNKFTFEYLSSTYRVTNIGGTSISGSNSYAAIFENVNNWFTFDSLSSSSIQITTEGNIKPYSTTNCFVFTNGTVTYTPISDVDLTDCKFGLVSTSADYAGFLQSLTGYASVEGTPLDDLSGVLPTEYNPSLSFPVNPDLSRPLDNQIIVGDVPGVSDLPLSDYQAKLKTDIDVPSIIVTKFPFCIPFDFMRFLGLLCSDPVAPVFRIPISTNPGNLDQWIGNQTIGEYLTPSEPMFEIDEEIVIDLSVIPLVQPICYTCFIVGFIIMLLHITPKMIQH